MTDGFGPEGWPVVIPRLFAEDEEGLVAFIRDVFGAKVHAVPGAPAELTIGDSMLMVSDGAGVRDVAPGFLYIYVSDVDATYRRACARGAQIIEEPTVMPYGDRRATIRDKWGNSWQIATRL